MSVMTNADVNMAVNTQTGSSNDKPDKPSLVELKNGKLVFKQKSLSFEKMSETMQEIVKFREMLEARLVAKDPPLHEVSEEHKPVIAKLVHESDKTLQALSKHIQQELLPTVDEDEEADITAILPLDAVEDAIKSVAKRVNYGLDSPFEGSKVPATWLIWRWEVLHSCRDWLPKATRDKVDNRCKERQQVKRDVKVLFESLSEDERLSIFGNKLSSKVPPKPKATVKTVPVIDLSTPTTDPSSLQTVSDDDPSATVNRKENEQDSSEKKTPSRPKKAVDPEKAAEKEAKERERQEKKAARAEREKKAQAVEEKSRSIMASFFGKTRQTAVEPPSKTNTKGRDVGSPGPTTTQSDFQRTFRPFALKKDVELAPNNWFRAHKRRSRRNTKLMKRTEDVIVIDDDEDECKSIIVEPQDIEMGRDVDTLSSREHLQEIISLLPSGCNPPRRPRQPTGYRTYNPLSVRGLVSQLTEAEVAGDASEVRRLLIILHDRREIPAKVLVFHEDARPGYFGTFTRNSHEVGPRSPFARDVIHVDYGYDSGEEWAEEDAGDADDVMEDAEEEGDADEEPDSDMDSWLVDDDEVEEPGTPIEERPGSPGFPPFDRIPSGSTSGKRKAKEEKEKEKCGGSKKRRVVVPLVPFTRGPEWENTVGRCAYDPFKAYRIQLFNDTPFPIDPFKFVSHPVDHQPASGGINSKLTADGFAIPALPPHIANASSSLPASSSTESNAASTGGTKRSVPAPRTAFPDPHLPLLLERIETLETSSLQGIVEAVHRELQVHKVKKNAIEAKIREVGEKCKFRKVWVVKPDVKAQHGMS